MCVNFMYVNVDVTYIWLRARNSHFHGQQNTTKCNTVNVFCYKYSSLLYGVQ